MTVSPEKKQELKDRMGRLGILESDLEEKFVIGQGRGGQNLHKTASCVQLKHAPSGIVIKCAKTRSRDDNRFFARRLLCEALEDPLGMKEAEKIRHQKKRRQRRRKK